MMGTRIALSLATRRIGMVIVTLIGATACGGDCAGVASPAFSIDVVDAVTGRAAATGATVYVFRRPDLSLVDAVASEDTLRILAAWDQSGRFDVLLEKAGYWPWTQNNVLVETHASCTTRTVHLIARLRVRST